jgi:uncharacterized protein with GYD domain
MATYVVLSDWTDQGIEKFRDTVDRFQAGIDQFEAAGVTFKNFYWTFGGHDMVSIVEAPDDETLAAVVLKQVSLGNFRTTVLRAFTAEEMKGVIARTG